METTQPIVHVLHVSPLHLSAHAIRECHASHDKSDTRAHQLEASTNATLEDNYGFNSSRLCGPKDAALIGRVGVKMKHASTLEHINVTLSISNISRALLQEWSRTRIMSQTVKSSRYTLGELKEEPLFSEYGSSYYGDVEATFASDAFDRAVKYLYFTGNKDVDNASILALEQLRKLIQSGISNDIAKYALPEAFLTSLTATINFRSLRNMLSLRTAPSALAEYRTLAQAIFDAIPAEYQYLLEDCLYES